MTSTLPGFRHELRATLNLAAPLAMAQLAQMGMGVTDTVMLGGLGPDAIAAGGLGSMMFMSFSAVLQGQVMGVGILVAHARGANTLDRIAPILRAGVVLALVACLPLLILGLNCERVLMALGEPETLAHAVARYDHILMLAAPATLGLALQRSFLAAMGRARALMMISISALLLNGFLNYGLIYGHGGLPEMGYLGSATATLITIWLAMFVTGAVVRKTEFPGRLRGPMDWALVRELGNLGWPIVITLGVEIILFLVGSLMMGFLGTPVLAAHQIIMNIVSLTYMIPLATAQAANVRVGFFMGAGAPHSARRAASASFVFGVGFMAIAAVAFFLVPRQIALLYNLKPDIAADAEVIDIVVRLLWICAFFQVLDGAQTIAAGALRGLKDTRVPMILAGLGYWAIGFPVAWLLGFPLKMGAEGVWWGFALSLLVVAIVLNFRFWRLIDRYVVASHATKGA